MAENSHPDWQKVCVAACEGTEIGLVDDHEGLLRIVIRRKGEDWPHGITPADGNFKIITPGMVACSFQLKGNAKMTVHGGTPIMVFRYDLEVDR